MSASESRRAGSKSTYPDSARHHVVFSGAHVAEQVEVVVEPFEIVDRLVDGLAPDRQGLVDHDLPRLGRDVGELRTAGTTAHCGVLGLATPVQSGEPFTQTRNEEVHRLGDGRRGHVGADEPTVDVERCPRVRGALACRIGRHPQVDPGEEHRSTRAGVQPCHLPARVLAFVGRHRPVGLHHDIGSVRRRHHGQLLSSRVPVPIVGAPADGQ
jgi:hypothetical protein